MSKKPGVGINSYDRDAPVPQVESRWIWAADKPLWPVGARETITVTEVTWNGEEWWVRSSGPSGLHWNDLEVFWQSVTEPGSA